MPDLTTVMKKYGFTESETKVYLTLLSNEQMTGYEISKQSGVPRSKVYNLLETLVKKNVVLVTPSENKVYRAIDPTEFVDQVTHQFNADVTTLDTELTAAYHHPQTNDQLWQVNDLTGLLAKARCLIQNAHSQLLIQIWADELTSEMITLLADAEKRLAQVIIILFQADKAELPFQHAYYHGFEADKLSEFRARWLNVVADEQEVVYGTITDHTAHGVWTENPAMVKLAGEYIRHDAYTLKIIHDLPDDLRQKYGLDLEGIRNIF